MRTVDRDLTGIRFAYGAEDILPENIGTPSEPATRAYLAMQQSIIENVRERGGALVESNNPLPPSEDWPTYRLNAPGWDDPVTARNLMERLMQTQDIGLVPQVEAVRFIICPCRSTSPPGPARAAGRWTAVCISIYGRSKRARKIPH